MIDGRPNKRYCSTNCKERAGQLERRNRNGSAPRNIAVSGSVRSVIEGTNGVLIAEVARLGHLGGETTTVVDTTFGEGQFWTRYRPANLVTLDRFKGAGLRADFRELPFRDRSLPVVVFDPPYISTGTRDKTTVEDLYDRFGIGDFKGWRAVRKLIDDGLAECARVLAPRGRLLVKCMDYTESGRKVWNTFHVYDEAARLGLQLVDRFHHLTGGGPQPQTNLDGSPREQKTAREVASMLLVFTNGRNGR